MAVSIGISSTPAHTSLATRQDSGITCLNPVAAIIAIFLGHMVLLLLSTYHLL